MKTTIFTIATMIYGLLSFGKVPNSTNTPITVDNSKVTQTSFPTDEMVSGYLKIKNALVKSDTKAASNAAQGFEIALNSIDAGQLSAEQKITALKLAAETKKQVKIIAANSGKLDTQRKAFQQLSNTINELVTTFGASQKLYIDFCPMYEEGSIWISETKAIKNPYYGAQMLTCGRIKEPIE